MPIILAQKSYDLLYDDIVGEQYHFPRRYWAYVQPGQVFAYYHPAEKEDTNRYYFGMGRIGAVRADARMSDHRYAEIIDYVPFQAPVPFIVNGEYLEHRPDAGPQFFRAVRLVSDGVFQRILDIAQADPETVLEFRRVQDSEDFDQIIADLNSQYKDLAPQSYKTVGGRIDRPTSISRALKEELGYACQMCGAEGFEKKSGGKYVEVHHLVELHKLMPGSLVSENILVVCANCHRKLHYADVEMRASSPRILRITVNGIDHRVRRNVR